MRGEIARLLPETQVLELQTQMLARAEARQRAAKEAQTTVETEQRNRETLRRERAGFASVLVPTVLLGSTVWIAFLSLGNVRERRPEIGLLRAIGVKTRQVLGLFLGRALMIGLVGGALGYVGGVLVASLWKEGAMVSCATRFWYDPGLLAMVLVLAPLFSVLASWLPSLLAAQQDPADVLSQE